MGQSNSKGVSREKMIKDLKVDLSLGEELDLSNPQVYSKACRDYSAIIKPGIDATDRALLLSRETAHTRAYKK